MRTAILLYLVWTCKSSGQGFAILRTHLATPDVARLPLTLQGIRLTNPSSLLWLFDLSWWRDVSEVLVGKDGKMSPRNAGRFLEMLADREQVFEANLKMVKPAKGETRAEVEKHFRDKYERLKTFLRQAIDSKESVQCSLCSAGANGGFRRKGAGERSSASFLAALSVAYRRWWCQATGLSL
jgi:hypothetical protein